MPKLIMTEKNGDAEHACQDNRFAARSDAHSTAGPAV
jgi:hypothetical protein